MLRSEEWAVFLIMMFPITTYLIICPLVFLAGLVDSMAGGGGLISLPAYLLAGIPPHQAIATNKLSSSIGTTASTLRYLRHGCVNYRVAIPAAVLAIFWIPLFYVMICSFFDRTDSASEGVKEDSL